LGSPYVFSFGENLGLALCQCKVFGQDLPSDPRLRVSDLRAASLTGARPRVSLPRLTARARSDQVLALQPKKWPSA